MGLKGRDRDQPSDVESEREALRRQRVDAANELAALKRALSERVADAIVLGLRRQGYAVDSAYDCLDGYVKSRVHPYDLVCLDINLPGMDGRELCRRLRETADAA